MRQDQFEVQFQLAVARQQIVEVAIEKAVAPDQFEHQVQVQPDILDIRAAPVGHGQDAFDFRLELDEDRVDDVVLVTEVVIQVSRRNVHLFRNHGRRDIRLTKLIEQAQRQLQDAFAGTAWCFL
ncbi:hypothetical protein D3C72_1678800 [compost metagenome]